jgi:hypothetical protein
MAPRFLTSARPCRHSRERWVDPGASMDPVDTGKQRLPLPEIEGQLFGHPNRGPLP